MKSVQITQLSLESLATKFLQNSAGEWKSQRRYYTLKKEAKPQEVLSYIKVRFLETGSPELLKLAKLHQLDESKSFVCGAEVIWDSQYPEKNRQPSQGSTVFGVLGNILYRDRGFATSDPVIATYSFINPQTMCLRTEYNGSVFEEEIKLIGNKYRTRQTIISRAGEELTIGQYLEKRI